MRSSEPECVYCGAKNRLTTDHVPPKGLFSKPRPNNLITVPCCFDCNNSASTEDEYFKNMIAFKKESFDHPDIQGILPGIFRGLSRKEQTGFRTSLFSTIQEIEVETKSGIYLGKKASFSVDKGRLGRVAERIVKGLYWHHNNGSIPKNWTIVPYLIEETILSNYSAMEKIVRWFRDREGKQIGQGVFRYWIAKDDNGDAEIWWLTFYHQTDFMVLLYENKNGK